ncbi:MAG: hypothetical protein Q8R79_01285 [Legionellaceae bacterium]|nr:hypothetical protein [Legionellaceae bacterium]
MKLKYLTVALLLPVLTACSSISSMFNDDEYQNSGVYTQPVRPNFSADTKAAMTKKKQETTNAVTDPSAAAVQTTAPTVSTPSPTVSAGMPTTKIPNTPVGNANGVPVVAPSFGQ